MFIPVFWGVAAVTPFLCLCLSFEGIGAVVLPLGAGLWPLRVMPLGLSPSGHGAGRRLPSRWRVSWAVGRAEDPPRAVSDRYGSVGDIRRVVACAGRLDFVMRGGEALQVTSDSGSYGVKQWENDGLAEDLVSNRIGRLC